MPVSFLAFIVLNSLKSNWHLAASYQLPVRKRQWIDIRLPFASFLLSINRFKPPQIELASGCHLPVANSLECANRHLAAVCKVPIPISAFIVLNPLKSNWHLAASCQLPIHTNRRISIWLPFAGFLSSFYCFKPTQIELASGCQLPVANSHKQAKASGCRLPVSYLAFIVLNPLKSNWHLAASCQLPIHTNRRISIWLPFAGFLSSFYCFKPSQIELASGCQLPVANSHKQAN